MGKPGDSNTLKTCCVPQCKSRQTGDILMFLFPKDESMKKRWTDAIKIDKRITPQMQVCSRHFTKNDFLVSGTTKKLKRTAVPAQNLPWQFPNKHVSPTLAKARSERLKNRTQQKTPDTKKGVNKAKTPGSTDTSTDDENDQEKSVKIAEDPFDKLMESNEDAADRNKSQTAKGKDTQQAEKASDPEKKETALPERAPTRLTQREGVLKCELCGRKCLTPQALRTHQQIAHKNIKNSLSDLDEDQLAINKAKESPKPTPMALISVKSRASLMEPKSLKKVNSAETQSKMGSLVEQVLQNNDSDSMDSESDDSAGKIDLTNQFKPQREYKRKTEFECPKCKKRFAVLFSARKHIEKHHMGIRKSQFPYVECGGSANSTPSTSGYQFNVQVSKDEDNSDSASSIVNRKHHLREQEKIGRSSKRVRRSLCEERPQLAVTSSVAASSSSDSCHLPPELRPLRIEICTICSMTLTSNIHLCAGPLKLASAFICAACNQEFKTLVLFDLHKSGMHSDGVESMFFPSLDELENWKLKMQEQTQASYTVLDQNDTKKIHRCTHLVHYGTGANRRTRLCPSSIIVQEFTKGFQVHYYPNHHGHDSTSYNLSQAFSKFSIASLMNITASQLPDDSDDDDLKETDLYLQFRKLTDYLVTDAARINVRGLKMLMRKALEMTAIINNYNEDEDSLSFSDADNDLKEQVKNALRRYKRPQLKRTSSSINESSAKRSKPVFQSTENTLKDKSKVVKPISPVIKIKVGNENVNGQKSVSEPKNSGSFIDSFQEFVGKTREQVKRKRNGQQNDKKEIVKTKMGQFKPSPKKNLSPTVDPVSPSRNSLSGVKDLEYEVKEQENDCNILILKI